MTSTVKESMVNVVAAQAGPTLAMPHSSPARAAHSARETLQILRRRELLCVGKSQHKAAQCGQNHD